jgi:hypothetical protein
MNPQAPSCPKSIGDCVRENTCFFCENFDGQRRQLPDCAGDDSSHACETVHLSVGRSKSEAS